MRRILIFTCVSIFVVTSFSSDLFAQVSRLKSVASRKRSPSSLKSGDKVLKIDKIIGVGNRAEVETPVYSTSDARGINSPKKWAQIEVTYQTARSDAKWLDDLTFTYYALAKKVENKKISFTLYQKNIHYVDIELGRKPIMHRSTVFLRPSIVKRKGHLIAAAVEISYDGEIIDIASDVAPSANLPRSEKGKWWKNPLITESTKTTSDKSSLLDRSHSPWAFVNIDDYEVIK